MLAKDALRGIHLIYTRDTAHWQSAQRALANSGASLTHFPLLAFKSMTLSAQAHAYCAGSDILLYTSANAEHFLHQQFTPQPEQQLVAIGPHTANALRKALPQHALFTAPAPYHSEALLNVWRPQDKRIAIIAAPHGRQLLANTLIKNNTVEIITPYQRTNPQATPSALPWQDQQHNVLLVTSQQAGKHLWEITPQAQQKLLQYELCVAAISARVAKFFEQLGFRHIICSPAADEDALLDCVASWWASQH